MRVTLKLLKYGKLSYFAKCKDLVNRENIVNISRAFRIRWFEHIQKEQKQASQSITEWNSVKSRSRGALSTVIYQGPC